MKKHKTAEITLEYQNYIQNVPVARESLYAEASKNDQTTIDHWKETWLKNIRANHKRFGSFSEHSVGQFWNRFIYQPCVVAGAGPSLKRNGHELKERGKIPLVSCLHNFHFFEDHGVEVDFYVTLDAGEITIEEVSEGGSKTEEEYWEKTKGKKLLAYIATSPRLLEKWQGEVYFFNCPMPDPALDQAIDEIEKFHTYVSTGGNVLGACVYLAKAIFGGNPIIYVGADFSFSYDKKFHAWDSKYDKTLGQVLRSVDVFGNKVYTWPSYHGFKSFFDWMAESVPGLYINCTEGGSLGAYPDGNIMAIRQMDLCEFLGMYHLSDKTKASCENPSIEEKLILY